MYQLGIVYNGQKTNIKRLSDNIFIPFDTANTDYQQFKKDIQNGVVLNDAEGNTMDAAQIATFLTTLP